MSINFPQQRTQFRTDMNNFQTQAQKDGVNLQSIRQQALAGLPANSTPQQQQAAVQAAVQQAVQNTNDPTLGQDYNQVQQDRAKMKGHHGHHHKPQGAGQSQDTSAQTIINEGNGASVADITSALSGMSSTDPNYATLQSMLLTAEQQQPQQQSPNIFGTGMNYMG